MYTSRNGLASTGAECQAPPMNRERPLLEVCSASAEFAIAAVTAGADRVELCANLVEGGTTPSLAEVEVATERLDVPVMVMVRPRGGDFLYSDVEFEVMARDVTLIKEAGADGIVFGVLDAAGRIDRSRTERLIAAARPLPVTFHRAFDVSRDLSESLDTLLEMGVDRILTSAGRACVLDDLPLLTSLFERAGDAAVILPGGGIRGDNVGEVLAVPGVRELHIGASAYRASPMDFQVVDVPMGRAYEPDEYSREVADQALIRGVADALADALGEGGA
jgi:copper homeostasis protein